ncbi:integrase/recombinase xerD homolog [Saccostrea echinata]|uniref:integrase/recombinase xerD homolog n=1 Tax=Saccostrea echinata TaxID=191078 RepID=UPI002A82ED4B|nr:integrase/recombinase xerD homolog [Saccostrea echinata]
MPRQKRGLSQPKTAQPSKRKRSATKSTPCTVVNEQQTETTSPAAMNTNAVQVDYVKLAAEILKQQNAASQQTALIRDPSDTSAPSPSAPSTLALSTSAPSTLAPATSDQPPPATSSASQAVDLLSLIDNVFSSKTGGCQHCPKSVFNTNIHSVSLTRDLSASSQHLLQAALSTSSRVAYHRSWQLFLQWKPSFTSLPVSEVDLCNFIGYLFSENYAPSSVSSHVSAIGYLHKICSLPDPTEKFLPKKLLKGCHALVPQQDTRLPITTDILRKIIQAINIVEPLLGNRLLLKAFYLLAFQAFLRIGELATRSANSNHVLQRSDVSFRVSNGILSGVTIVMKHFKNNTEQKPVTLHLSNSSSITFCPVKALYDYTTHFAHTSGPLFQFMSGEPVTHHFISQQLCKLVSFIGLDPKLYKGHSFRIGAATHAASLGFSENYIQKLGRWRSNAVRRYIRISSFDI